MEFNAKLDDGLIQTWQRYLNQLRCPATPLALQESVEVMINDSQKLNYLNLLLMQNISD